MIDATGGTAAAMSEDRATQDRPAAKLKAAAKLVEQALLALDTHAVPCGRCGAKEFRNLTHRRVFERLHDLPEKLRTTAEKLDEADAPRAVGAR